MTRPIKADDAQRRVAPFHDASPFTAARVRPADAASIHGATTSLLDWLAPAPWAAATGAPVAHRRTAKAVFAPVSHAGQARPDWLESLIPTPWVALAGGHVCARADHSAADVGANRPSARPLYTPEERVRRDRSVWTLVQGVLAPLQFLAFAISLVLVVRYLLTGAGFEVATASVIVKTILLYTIMITGSVWEKVVFGKWLFAPAFFWEDVFSMLVLALHTAYLAAVLLNIGSPEAQMGLALAAYLTYVVNAGQFVWKLRQARLESRPEAGAHAAQTLGGSAIAGGAR